MQQDDGLISNLKRFFPQDANGHALMNVGLYFSFHFPDGFKAGARRRAAAVAADYWRVAGSGMRWMTLPLKHTWQPVPPAYDMAAWLQAYPADDWVWQMIFHGGQVPEEAADRLIVGLGDSLQVHAHSSLFLVLPLTWFADHPGQQALDLYLRWAALMQAPFGTAGIGLIPPEDEPRRAQTSPLAESFSARYPGVELVDTIGNQHAQHGQLACNWLTAIDTAAIDRLGGQAPALSQLQSVAGGDQVAWHGYEGGAVLASGPEPSLFEPGRPAAPPAAYKAVAQLLKPLRTTQPGRSWGCPKSRSLDWLARFD